MSNEKGEVIMESKKTFVKSKAEKFAKIYAVSVSALCCAAASVMLMSGNQSGLNVSALEGSTGTTTAKTEVTWDTSRPPMWFLDPEYNATGTTTGADMVIGTTTETTAETVNTGDTTRPPFWFINGEFELTGTQTKARAETVSKPHHTYGTYPMPSPTTETTAKPIC